MTAWAGLNVKGAIGPMEGPGSAVPGVSSRGANLLASLCSLRSPLVYAHCGASSLGSFWSICDDDHEGESSWNQDDIMVGQ